MKNKVNYRPANSVRVSKAFIILIGCVCIIGSIPLFADDFDTGLIAAFMGVMCFITGGILSGLAVIADAACEYSWEFDHKYTRKPAAVKNEEQPVIDDSEVQ